MGLISLVPMAGRGSRFVADGYRLPKPFIPILGKPMFVRALQSFPPADRHIFICQQWFLDRYPFADETRRYFPDSVVLAVDQVTEGQACTCLLAEPEMSPDDSLLISSIDYQTIYDQQVFDSLVEDKSVDVVIFTFQFEGIVNKDPKAFAYCRTEGDRVIEVVEKQTISDTPEQDPAVVGSFYYRQVADFVTGARQMIARNIRVNNEFYVGTSINQLIEGGADVRIFPIDKFVCFGDPMELQIYEAWEDYFFNEPTHPYHGWQRS